jgi:hypothetical protein
MHHSTCLFVDRNTPALHNTGTLHMHTAVAVAVADISNAIQRCPAGIHQYQQAGRDHEVRVRLERNAMLQESPSTCTVDAYGALA